MKVVNIHKRTIDQPKEKIAELINTLATDQDKIWPSEYWPEMKFNGGLKEGAEGGHGPIKYTVEKYVPGELILFRFLKPTGYHGIHKFEMTGSNNGTTEIKHTIDMNATGMGVLSWAIVIRWLHDALMEDFFDKIENQFSQVQQKTEWTVWVRFLRAILK